MKASTRNSGLHSKLADIPHIHIRYSNSITLFISLLQIALRTATSPFAVERLECLNPHNVSTKNSINTNVINNKYYSLQPVLNAPSGIEDFAISFTIFNKMRIGRISVTEKIV